MTRIKQDNKGLRKTQNPDKFAQEGMVMAEAVESEKITD